MKISKVLHDSYRSLWFLGDLNLIQKGTIDKQIVKRIVKRYVIRML